MDGTHHPIHYLYMSHLFTIIKSTHNFLVKNLEIRGKQAVEDFARRYIQRGMIRTADGGFHMTPVKVYAAAKKDRTEYRFHINQYDEFITFLNDRYITENLYTEYQNPVPVPVHIKAPVKPKWVAREEQVPV